MAFSKQPDKGNAMDLVADALRHKLRWAGIRRV